MNVHENVIYNNTKNCKHFIRIEVVKVCLLSKYYTVLVFKSDVDY